MSWATNSAPRTTSSPNMGGSPTLPRSPSSAGSGWGTSANQPVRATSQASPQARSTTSSVSNTGSGWGTSTSSPSTVSRSVSTPNTAGWGSTQPRPGQGSVDPNRHQTGGTSSWGAQSGARLQPGQQQERTFTDDVLEAGNQAYQQYVDELREKEALTPEVTTQRMLRLAQETTDIADRTISTLEIQNDELKRQQQEVADLNNDLNTAEKKMKAIKSGWGGLATLGSAKKHDQYSKRLDKWEHERDKTNFKQEAQDQKESYQQGKLNLHNNEKLIGETTHDLHKEQHQFKKESRNEAREIRKGRADQREETVNFGGFIFEERVEGTGPKHQAERDLEDLSTYTQGLKQRAYAQADLTQETTERINHINDGVGHAQNRSQALNANMNRYVKKNG